MRYASLVLLLFLTLALGCGRTYSEGTKIDAEKRSELIKGGTTQAKVLDLFGTPDKIETLPTGGEKYIYEYYDEQYEHWYRLPKYDKQRLEVLIKGTLVQSYTFVREGRGLITEQDLKEKVMK